jgi:hypothetical protein
MQSNTVRKLSYATALVALAALVHVPVEAAELSEARMRRDIEFLASDELEGRGVTTPGINKAADFIAAEFRKMGLKPGGKNNSYFQPFTMPGGILVSAGKLQLTGPMGQVLDLKPGVQFNTLGMSHPGDVTGPVVFVGYGITTGKNEKFTYDDYKDVDVAGKIVVVLRDTPNAGNRHLPFAGPQRQMHASFTQKMKNALAHKAAGILFVSDRDTTKAGDDLLGFGFTAAAPSASKLPAFHVRRSVIDMMLRASLDKGLADIERDMDRDWQPRSASLAGWSAHLVADVKRDGISVKNVVGVLEGNGPLADETIVIGAHYDHLGYGGPSSLAGMKTQAIHHGADDNGSGTTTLLELARRFAAQPERAGRRLVFIAFSGEESGLLGSAYYCKNPIFPLEKTVTMVNMDMVGRLRSDKAGPWSKMLSLMTPVSANVFPVLPLAHAAVGVKATDFEPRDKLIVYGTGTAKTFDKLVEETNRKHNFRLNKVPGGFGPSDHASFYAKKIPVFFFFTGDHPDYHRPGDTANKINVEGMARIATFVQEVVVALAQGPTRPEYVQVKDSGPRPEGRIPRLGIRPDYSDDSEGVLLGDVSPDGPAARGGLKSGDRIVAINDKPVKDLKAYMSVIAGHKPGTALEVSIMRAGKKQKLKVVPE